MFDGNSTIMYVRAMFENSVSVTTQNCCLCDVLCFMRGWPCHALNELS